MEKLFWSINYLEVIESVRIKIIWILLLLVRYNKVKYRYFSWDVSLFITFSTGVQIANIVYQHFKGTIQNLIKNKHIFFINWLFIDVLSKKDLFSPHLCWKWIYNVRNPVSFLYFFASLLPSLIFLHFFLWRDVLTLTLQYLHGNILSPCSLSSPRGRLFAHQKKKTSRNS